MDLTFFGATGTVTGCYTSCASPMDWRIRRAATCAKFLTGWAVGALETMKPLTRYQKGFEIAGAVVLLITGLYILNAFFLVIPQLAV